MYQIKVLNNEEFDEIIKSDPKYSYVDDTNLGFSDKEKGIAYVRDTEIDDLNKYLISHEFEHLLEEEGTHEDAHGIRHKKGPKFFKSVLLPLVTGFDAHKGSFSPFGLLGQPSQAEVNAKRDAEEGGVALNQEPTFPQISPFSQFSIPGDTSATSRVPDFLSQGANITSSLNQGSVNGIPPEVLEQLRRGNYSGRFTF